MDYNNWANQSFVGLRRKHNAINSFKKKRYMSANYHNVYINYQSSIHSFCKQLVGIPRWLSGKEFTCQCRKHQRCRLNPWVRKIPCRRKWQSTPGFLPGESHGQRSLLGYSHKKRDMTEQLSTYTRASNSYIPTLVEL